MRQAPLFFRMRTGALVFAAVLAGCAFGTDRRQIDELIAGGRCEKAVRIMEESRDRYGDNGRLLYLLDSAMVRLQCGRYDAAQRFFHEAERTADRLWTESISRNAASLLINDYMRPYPGEDYERAMIHLMSAIGYLQMGQPEEARVETRRLDTLLHLYNDKYIEKNVYKEDAFGRYLSGMLNEDDSAVDDAFIDYLLAARAYEDYKKAYGTRLPQALAEDLLRVGAAVGRAEEAASALGNNREFSEIPARDAGKRGRVVYIHFSGDAPEKVQDTLFIPTGRGPITLAFPKMVVRPPACGGGRLILQNDATLVELGTELVEDINRIAVKNLNDRKGRVIARTLARAVVKQLAIEGAAIQGDAETAEAIRVILNALNLFVERADIRSWRTLPGEIHMARDYVPPGTYEAVLSSCGQRTVLAEPLQVEAGRTRYLFYDSRYGVSDKSSTGKGDE